MDFINDEDILRVYEKGGVLISDVEYPVELLEQDSLTLEDGRIIKRHCLFVTVCFHDTDDEGPFMGFYLGDKPFDVFEVTGHSRG